MENKLYMPQGLPVNPVDPLWLSTSWPMSTLESSIASVISVMGIFAGIAIVAFILAVVAKTFLPKVLNRIVQFSLIAVAALGLAGAGLSLVSWNADNNISDHAMGVQVAKLMDWASVRGVTMDLQSAWDLTCGLYEEKNENCRDTHPTVQYQGESKEVRLERMPEGNVVLYDFEELIPFVQ